MRKVLTAVLVLLAACEVESSSRSSQQAVFEAPGLPVLATPLPPPRAVGTTKAMLGWSLAACRGEGYVAGEPGIASVLLVRGDAGIALGPFGAGLTASGAAVGCEDHPNSRRVVFTGGTSGLYVGETDGGSTHIFQGVQVAALSRSPEANVLLVGEPGVIKLISSLTAQFAGGTVTGSGSFGASVVLPSPDAGFFAVGDPTGSKVYLYEATDGGIVTFSPISGASNTRFGQALAVGDVHPSPGLELIISAPEADRVFVYANPRRFPGQQPLLELVPNYATVVGESEFGMALAVQPNAAQQLGGIMVGSPGDGRVQRYIGSTVDMTWELAGSRLGNAITVDRSMVVVGAPAANNEEGAVFELTTFRPNSGKQMACEVGEACGLPNCTAGTCVGGVFCSDTPTMACPTACVAPAVCVLDGGSGAGGGGGGGVIPVGGGMGTLGGGVGATVGGGGGAMAGGGNGTVGGGVGATGGGGAMAGGGNGSIGGGSAVTGGGDGSTGGGAPSGGGSANTGGGSANAGGGSANAGGGSANTGGGSANTGGAGNTGGGAGGEDAGASGGGANQSADLVQYNATCGCSSGAALPTLLMGLFLVRRWRRSSATKR